MKTIFKRNGNVYHMSYGNRKLVQNENTFFVIWNIPAKKSCPYKTPHCTISCYADKAERLYKAVLPARVDNFEASKSDTFVPDMIYILETVSKSTKKPEIIVRIHESGDFYNRKYTEKWLAIMEHFAADPRFKFIAYTKSFPYFDGVDLPANFHIRASIWDDTPIEMINLILKNQWPIYTAVERFTPEDTFSQCRCKDCATCGHCWNSSIQDIRCEIH